MYNVAEGAVRAARQWILRIYLRRDENHTGQDPPGYWVPLCIVKLNIGDANGFGVDRYSGAIRTGEVQGQ